MPSGDGYWSAWAPYWSHIEDNYLDLNSLDGLAGVITDPALVIGAGQGLLVEHLAKQGLTTHGVDLDPVMIEYALERRGLRLIHASGTDLPMADHTHGTSIIATGVVDLMDDEDLIRSILDEARRVTRDTVLVAFYGLHPRTERLFRSAGLITSNERFCQKLVYEMATLNPFQLVSTMSRHLQVGYVRSMLALARFPLHLSPREFRMSRNLAAIFRKARRDLGSAAPLIDAAMETVPFRNEQAIRSLFTRLDLPIHELHAFETCHVVQTAA